MIEALIARSFDEAKNQSEAKYTLKGRVHALAQAYTTVTKAADHRASLRQLLVEQLTPFSDRISISGCEVAVSPSAAQQFALIVHELATNALKYGALSSEHGRVMVEGAVERLNAHKSFAFVWKEVGGPRVTAPSRKGFGSVILMDVAKQWAGDISADFSEGGLTYSLRMPLELIDTSTTGTVRLPA